MTLIVKVVMQIIQNFIKEDSFQLYQVRSDILQSTNLSILIITQVEHDYSKYFAGQGPQNRNNGSWKFNLFCPIWNFSLKSNKKQNETQITYKTYNHVYLALYMCAVLVHILDILILWLLFAKYNFKDSFYKDKNISSISDNFI